VVQLSPMRRTLALHFLEEAGAETSSTPMIAFLYGDLLRLTGERTRALPYLELAATDGPMLLRVDALESQGYAFARLDRAIEEAAVFQRALDLGVDNWARADLLANQAEAFMASGDLRQAIAGYRASIDCLRGPELMLAVTAFWGLAVALDRSGSTNEALHTIGIARQYDPMDRALGDEQWTFSPEVDGAWYRALGALVRARTSTDVADRVVAYRAAIDGFVDYLKHAPPDGPYVEIARKHVERLEAEALTVPEPAMAAAR
jgi:tetratricopeptide (TPR) repeat protein